jgi:hypothetical protein
MDGDGLVDQNVLVAADDGGAFPVYTTYTLFNLGDGTFSPQPESTNGGPPLPSAGRFATKWLMADVNADGLDDYVELSTFALKVCVRSERANAQQGWVCQSAPFQDACTLDGSGLVQPDGGPSPYSSLLGNSFVGVADLDGSGAPRILYRRVAVEDTGNPTNPRHCIDDSITAYTVTPQSGTVGAGLPTSFPQGLLQSVTALGGAQQSLSYQSVNSLGVGAVPVAMWVATSMTSSNGIAPGVATAVHQTVSYSYQSPVYDPRDRQFVGFESSTESHSGDVGAPGLVRTTSYATTACGPASGTSCTGQVDYGWFRALRGLPITVNESDTTGANQTTTLNQYAEYPTYVGIDQRVVRRLILSDQMQYQWSPGNSQSVAQTTQAFSGFDAITSPYENYSAAHTFAVHIPTVNATHEQQWTQDNLGDQKSTVDLGEPGVDKPILTEMTWALPPGDTTGWSYRLTTKVVGYSQSGRPRPLRPHGNGVVPGEGRSYAYTYTSQGLLSTQTATVNDPAPMSTATGFMAGTPPDATTSTTVCITGCAPGGIQYDPYGNPTTTPTANNRCTSTAYDPLFAQFPATVTAYLGGCGSTNPAPMVSTVVYDRGLQQVSMRHDPVQAQATALVSMFTYEPFGRMYQAFQPSAEMVGLTDNVAAMTAQYDDQGPVRTVLTSNIDSVLSGGVAIYQQHEKFIDAFSETLATSTTAGV